MIFQVEMNGINNASADPNVFGEASSVLSVYVNGEFVQAKQNFKTSVGANSSGNGPGRVQIQFGTPFAVSAELRATADLMAINVTSQFDTFSGSAISNFGNSAGITSFTLFEAGTDDMLIPDWNLDSESGQFGFYSAVVPIPATAWLFAGSFGLLIPWVKRKTKA